MCSLANDFIIAATIIFFLSGLCIIILDEKESNVSQNI